MRWMRRRPGRGRKPVRQPNGEEQTEAEREREAATPATTRIPAAWGPRPPTDGRERTSTDQVWRRGEGDVLPEEEEAEDVPLQDVLGERDPSADDREEA